MVPPVTRQVRISRKHGLENFYGPTDVLLRIFECNKRELADVLGEYDGDGAIGSIETLNGEARASNGLLEEHRAKVFHEIAGEKPVVQRRKDIMRYTPQPRLFTGGLQSMRNRFLQQVLVHCCFGVKMRDSMVTIESRPDKVLNSCSFRGIH